MRARWPALAACVAFATGYLAYPYITLYRLDVAVRHADAESLRSMVDWYSVREGLKEDICDMVLDEPANGKSGAELAPFGASFVRGMTGNMLDQKITPETLVSLSNDSRRESHGDAHVVWAFFDNPTAFAVDVRADGAAEPIHVVMELRGLRWQVRRVWLPNELLERVPGT